MAGLREQQKADRERRILNAAITRFRADGYKTVRIEELAVLAEVSVGTVYNYYQTKGDILSAVVAMEVQEVIDAGAPVLRDPPQGVRAALLALVFAYYDHSLKYLSKEMWRTAMALAIEHPGTPNGRRYSDLDVRLEAQIRDLVCLLQERDEVKRTLDPGIIAQIIFNTINAKFTEFVKDDKMTMKALRTRVTHQIAPLARLISASETA